MTVTDLALTSAIENILADADLSTLTTKGVRSQLEKKFGVALSDRKPFIKQAVQTALQNMSKVDNNSEDDKEEEEEEEDEDEDEDEEEEEDEISSDESVSDSSDSVAKKKTTKKRKKKDKKSGEKRKGVEFILSPPLAKVLGVKSDTRPQVVKHVWAYIKKHDLQDPDNRRYINLDEPLREVFGLDGFGMFEMHKYLSDHLTREDGQVVAPKVKKAAKKEKGKRKKRVKREGDEKKPRGGGLTKPQQLSKELQKFMGGRETAGRTEVVKELWKHIKAKDLQNPENRREVFCDDVLRELMGHDTVTIYTMNKYIQPHFLKEADGEGIKTED